MTDQRVDRLEAAVREFERANPDIVEALGVLGVRVEDFEAGMLNLSSGPPTVQSDSTADAELTPISG